MTLRTCTTCSRSVTRAKCRRGHESGCPDCETASDCFYCGAALGSASSRTADGRRVCAACAATSIRDSRQALQLYRQVLATVQTDVGLPIAALPRFGLCPPNELRRLSRYVASRRGVDGRVLGVYFNVDDRGGILVEEGLPYWTLITVIAHEIGHAWQMENNATQNKPQMLEGFCEWIAWQVLGVLGGKRQQDRLLNQRRFHGKALRAVLAMEEEVGRAGLLEKMRLPAPVSA